MHYQVNNFNICSKDEVYKGYTKDYEHLPKTMLSCNVLANSLWAANASLMCPLVFNSASKKEES